MNQKRKLRKRIAAWLLCLVMVLATMNLPGFTMTANAAPTSTVKFLRLQSVSGSNK